MTQRLQEKLTLFTENTRALKNDFIWHDTMSKRLAALLYTLKDKAVDCNTIRDNHALLKSHTGIFSSFRGNLAIYIASMLSLSDNPEQRFTDTLAVYDLLKAQKFHASDYLVVAAYQIAANADRSLHSQTVTRAREFYDAMKSNHWFYTGQDDYIFSAMLGLSDIDVYTAAAEIERLYQQAKTDFYHKNSIQTLAQVLVLGGEADVTYPKVLQLRNTLRENGIKIDKLYTLPSLGVLAMLTADGYAVAEAIAETSEALRKQKGFGVFSITTQELLLYTVSLVCAALSEDIENGILKAVVSTSVTNLIIAQQAAMAVVIASSASTAATH